MENILNSILLIDDDVATNFINKRIIQKSNINISIQVASNGKEALDHLNNYTPLDDSGLQLILLDINMPVMDGWEFIENYRSLDKEYKKHNIIVMLSSSFNPADKAKADAIPEISEFRQKPMSKDALIEIIRTYFPETVSEAVL